MRYIKYLEVENFKKFRRRDRFDFDNFKDLKYIFEKHVATGNSVLMDAMSFVLGCDSTRTNRLSDLINRNEAEKTIFVTACVTLCCCAGVSGDEIKFSRIICSNRSGFFKINTKVVVKKDYLQQLQVIGLLGVDKYCLVLEAAAVLFSMKSRWQQTQIFEAMSGSSSSKLRKKCEQLTADINEQEKQVPLVNVEKYYLFKLFHYQKWKSELESFVEENYSRIIRKLNEENMKTNNNSRCKKAALKIVEEKLKDEELKVRDTKENDAQTQACFKLREEAVKIAKEGFDRAKNAYSDQRSTIDRLNESIRDRERKLSAIKNDNTIPEYDDLKKQVEKSLSGFYQQLKELREEKSAQQIQRDSAKSQIKDLEAKLERVKVLLEKKLSSDNLHEEITVIVGHKRKWQEFESTANKVIVRNEETLSNVSAAAEAVHDERDEESLQSSLRSYQEKIIENKTLLKTCSDKLYRADTAIDEIEREMIGIEDKIFEGFCRSRGVKNIRQFLAKNSVGKKENDVKTIQLQYEIEQMKRRVEYERNCNSKFEEMNAAEDNLQFCERNLLALIIKEKKEVEELKKCISQLENVESRRNAIKAEIVAIESSIHENKIQIFEIGAKRAMIKLDIKTIGERRHRLFIKCKEKNVKLRFLNGNWSDVNYYTDTIEGDYSEEDHIVLDYSSLEPALKQLPSKDILVKGSSFKQFEDIIDPEEKNGPRRNLKRLQLDLEAVKNKRRRGFFQVFRHVNNRVDKIYKELTKSQSASATLYLENANEPYLDGVKYEFVTPPGKGIKKQLNEMTTEESYVAAMALLVAIQNYKNVPEEAEDGYRDLEQETIRKLVQLIQNRKQKQRDFMSRRLGDKV